MCRSTINIHEREREREREMYIVNNLFISSSIRYLDSFSQMRTNKNLRIEDKIFHRIYLYKKAGHTLMTPQIKEKRRKTARQCLQLYHIALTFQFFEFINVKRINIKIAITHRQINQKNLYLITKLKPKFKKKYLRWLRAPHLPRKSKGEETVKEEIRLSSFPPAQVQGCFTLHASIYVSMYLTYQFIYSFQLG